ncbi:MAG: hypothetical protein AAF941_02240 [Pseudomonadota bacterium]
MPYTFHSMEAHVRTLVQRNNIKDWQWGGTAADRGTIRDEVFDRYPNGTIERLVMQANNGSQHAKRELLICELTAYCYSCYEKAKNASGAQVIGRERDLKAAGLYEKVAEIVDTPGAGAKGSLFDNAAQGNLLLMNKWATVMNDAWLLGGIHRGADFRLASPQSLANLWNNPGGYLIVTGREILGLTAFGYRLHQDQNSPLRDLRVFRQGNRRGALATLLDYDDLIARRGSLATTLQMADPDTIVPAIDDWNRGSDFGQVMAQIFHINQAKNRPAAHQQNLNAVLGTLPNRVN